MVVYPRIIIVGTNEVVQERCISDLSAGFLVPERDFVFCRRTVEVSSFLSDWTRQLLVASFVDQSEQEADRIVRTAKRINRRLEAWWFPYVSHGLRPPYNRVIMQGPGKDICRNLAPELQVWLDGHSSPRF